MSILVDTSVWIDHLRKPNAELISILETYRVCIHPFILGELASGNLPQRSIFLKNLKLLPTIVIAAHDEVMQFIEIKKLHGHGLGFIDIHLLFSAKIHNLKLFTYDKKLEKIANSL